MPLQVIINEVYGELVEDDMMSINMAGTRIEAETILPKKHV